MTVVYWALGTVAFVIAVLILSYYLGLFVSRGYQRGRRESLNKIVNDCLHKEGN